MAIAPGKSGQTRWYSGVDFRHQKLSRRKRNPGSVAVEAASARAALHTRGCGAKIKKPFNSAAPQTELYIYLQVLPRSADLVRGQNLSRTEL
jgi:hypothetical protein